jgi:hypothetical protein
MISSRRKSVSTHPRGYFSTLRDRLRCLEHHYPWLLGSIAVTVLVPIITLYLRVVPTIFTIIRVIAGLVAFILGTYGIVLVKRIHES